MTASNFTVVNRRRALALACVATTFACSPADGARGATVAADAGNPDVLRRTIPGDVEGGQILFVHDPAVDAAHAARLPRTSFITAEGRGYRLSLAQPITPTMFGARVWRNAKFNPLDPLEVRACPDSTAALQAFFDFVFAHDGVTAEVNGRFGISSGLKIGPDLPLPDATRQFRGELMLIALGPIAGPMITARNLRDHVWFGSIVCIGRGGTAIAQRDVEAGVCFTGDCTSFRLTGRIASYYMSFANVVGVTRPSLDFLEWLSVGEISAYGCGAGPVVEDGTARDGARFKTQFQTMERQGAPGDLKQSATLEVEVLPPVAVERYGRIAADHGILIRIGDELHRIVSIDRKARRIRIFPWPDANRSRGELDYVFGGNLVLGGGDANLYRIGSVEAAFTSINYQCCGLFPGQVAAATAQACTVNMRLAGGPTRVSGGSTMGLYQENTLYGLVCASPGNVAHTILDADNSDLRSWMVLGPRNAQNRIEMPGLRGVVVQGKDGRVLQARRTPDNREEAPERRGGGYAVDGSTIVISDTDNFTLILQPYDPALDRLFGIDWLDVTITGKGTGGGPTGTIVVDAQQIAHSTVNGGAKTEFRGNGLPMRIVITANHQTGSFRAIHTSASIE